jgi:methyl-accepting chemotaxis protein
VASLLVISEAQTAVDSAENALLSLDIDLKARQEKYATFAAAWKRAEDAWKVYEPLPQTAEEADTCKKFVPAWEAWKKDHQAYVAMSKEFEGRGIQNPVVLQRDIQQFIGDHHKLMMMVLSHVMNGEECKGGDDPTACHYGKWLAKFESTNPELKRIVDSWRPHHDAFHAAVKKAKELAAKGDKEGAIHIVQSEAKASAEKVFEGFDALLAEAARGIELYKKMTEQALVTNAISFAPAEQLLNKLVEINRTVADEASKAAITQAGFMKTFSVVAMIIGSAVGILLAFFITRGITKPINRIIGELSTGAEQVASAAEQVSSASQSSAQGASEQASSLEETSSALEEMASMSKANAENADKANDLMSQTTHVVGQAQSGMRETSDAMIKINEASAKIAKIIKVIEEIAFQTNLLALNAAVEAARAGEHGKGFAVVADEVRNLAHRSAQAANETAQLISDTIDRVKKGTDLNSELEKSFVKVNESAGQVASLVEQITGASKAQAKGVDEINAAMVQMDKVVQQSAAGAEESSAASEELASQAQVLQQTVDQLSAMVSGGNHSQGTRMTVAKETKKASPTRHTQAQPHPHPAPHAETHTEGSKGKGQWNEF